MNWLTLAAVLCAWTVVGLGVAYLSGRFIRAVEAPENAADLIPPMLSYLRPKKRAKTSSRERATAPTKTRRELASRH
jgi:hypothetical protein